MADKIEINCSTSWVFLTCTLLYMAIFWGGCNKRASHYEHYLNARYGYYKQEVNYGSFSFKKPEWKEKQ